MGRGHHEKRPVRVDSNISHPPWNGRARWLTENILISLIFPHPRGRKHYTKPTLQQCSSSNTKKTKKHHTNTNKHYTREQSSCSMDLTSGHMQRPQKQKNYRGYRTSSRVGLGSEFMPINRTAGMMPHRRIGFATAITCAGRTRVHNTRT